MSNYLLTPDCWKFIKINIGITKQAHSRIRTHTHTQNTRTYRKKNGAKAHRFTFLLLKISIMLSSIFKLKKKIQRGVKSRAEHGSRAEERNKNI